MQWHIQSMRCIGCHTWVTLSIFYVIPTYSLTVCTDAIYTRNLTFSGPTQSNFTYKKPLIHVIYYYCHLYINSFGIPRKTLNDPWIRYHLYDILTFRTPQYKGFIKWYIDIGECGFIKNKKTDIMYNNVSQLQIFLF